ncbi:MAG: nucleoside-diphosphate kinase [Chloroflexi bacterium]|nr:nucleoside-diphosphate kinase [Chloroflexota bacterium]
MERTLVLAKPDAVQRGLAGTIIARLEARGLNIVAIKLIQIDRPMAERHYEAHIGKPFFEGLVRFITSSPVVATVLEGNRAIDIVRQTMGETDPAKATPGTIRGDFALDIGRNLVHGSDSPEAAQREIALFFDQADLLSYDRSLDPWIIES